MSAADTRSRVPRTAIIATPVGVYLAITGPFGRDWSGVETVVIAGGSFVLLLFLPWLFRAMSNASKRGAARRKVKAAKALEKTKTK